MSSKFKPSAVAIALAIAVALLSVGPATLPGSASAPARSYPWPERIDAAERFADQRAGVVSFAVVDERGDLRGDHPQRVHASASVVKAMLMVAYLRQAAVRDRPLTTDDRRLLEPMIRRSSNPAANQVYEHVGTGALYELARDAGMRRFSTQSVWGLSEITAADQARFFYRLERHVPERHEGYAMDLLTRIVHRQRWGIPPVAPRGWSLHFKGGWSPSSQGGWVVNQVLLLRDRSRRFSLAILTRFQPGKEYGTETIEGVAHRLLRGYNRLTR